MVKPQKQYVRIETVGKKSRQLEGRLKDGASVAIGLYEIPRAFRWPKVGEYWSVNNEHGTWMLGERLELDPDAEFPVENLQDDELRLDGKVIKDALGRVVGGGSDAHFVWTQNANATNWGDPAPGDPGGPKYIVHNLGKHPAVSVTDFGGNQVEVHVHYVDNDKVQISTTVPSSGIAYFN